MTNATGALLAPVDAGHTSGHSSAPPCAGPRALRAGADAAPARLSATRARIVALRGAVIQRAVSEYVEPASTSAFSELVSSRNLDDATRRRQLMSEVNGRSLDVLDQLHAAR